MRFKTHIAFALLLLCNSTLLAQWAHFRGKVLNSHRSPVHNALVETNHSSKKVYTDSLGYFTLKARPQDSVFHVHALGYAYKNEKAIADSLHTIILPGLLDSAFHPKEKLLDSIFEHQVINAKIYTGYSSQTFTKSEAFFHHIPFEIWMASGNLIPEKEYLGKVYVSESWSDNCYLDRFHFDQKFKLKREAGEIVAQNWNYLPATSISPFDDKFRLSTGLERGFYNPFARKNRNYYQYEVAGSYAYKHHKVYRITFKPAVKHRPLVSGHADFIDSAWVPLQMVLNMGHESPLELLDSLQINQLYSLEDGQYRQEYQRLSYHLNIIGFSGSYQVKQYHNNFSFSDTLRPGDFDQEVYSLPRNRMVEDSAVWDSIMPQSLEEDSLLFAKSSLQKNPTKWRFFRGTKLNREGLNGYNWLYRGHVFSYGHLYLGQYPFYKMFGFNPVEGPYLRYSFPLGLSFPSSEWQLEPEFRYGFSDREFKPSAKLSYNFDPASPKMLSLSGGRQYRQFNADQPILPVINTLYTLGLGSNFMRLYGRDFLELNMAVELWHNLTLNTKLNYAQRFALFNNTNFTLFENNNQYDPNNIALNDKIGPAGFPTHRALTYDLSLSYQFDQLYEYRYSQRVQRDLNLKKNIPTQKPRLYYNLRAGIPTEYSATHFIFQNLGIHYIFRAGNSGLSQFDISAGHFPVQNRTEFIDFKHFDGVQLFFLQPAPAPRNRIKQFGTLPYYGFSTTNAYLETHYEHFFEGTLLSHIGFFRRNNIHSLIGLNTLHLGNEKYFLETFFGFNNLFKIARLEYFVSLDNTQQVRQTVRLSFDFDYTFYLRNKVD